jgi:hypothetical protein
MQLPILTGTSSHQVLDYHYAFRNSGTSAPNYMLSHNFYFYSVTRTEIFLELCLGATIYFIVDLFLRLSHILDCLKWEGGGHILHLMASKNVAGIAIRCGLHGPGIESQWWQHFPHPSIVALGTIQPPTE